MDILFGNNCRDILADNRNIDNLFGDSLGSEMDEEMKYEDEYIEKEHDLDELLDFVNVAKGVLGSDLSITLGSLHSVYPNSVPKNIETLLVGSTKKDNNWITRLMSKNGI